MLFSDLNKIFVNANIIGKLPKKKIKFISDHSSNINANTLFVINQKKILNYHIFMKLFQKI